MVFVNLLFSWYLLEIFTHERATIGDFDKYMLSKQYFMRTVSYQRSFGFSVCLFFSWKNKISMNFNAKISIFKTSEKLSFLRGWCIKPQYVRMTFYTKHDSYERNLDNLQHASQHCKSNFTNTTGQNAVYPWHLVINRNIIQCF